jgi:translation initiation factor IF-3
MADKFLRAGCHVKLTVMFRWRELRRPELGYELLRRVSEDLSEVAKVEVAPPEKMEGRDLCMVLKPIG